MVIAQACTKWQSGMSDAKKPRHPEVNFLPPLDMVLAFFKKKDKPGVVNNTPQELDVKRIINHINDDEQPHADQKTND